MQDAVFCLSFDLISFCVFWKKESLTEFSAAEFATDVSYVLRIAVYSPKHPGSNLEGYVMEHRLIMEESIGRYLTDGEVVHHINKKRNDNRIENLKLMTVSEHMSYHMSERHKNRKG